MIREAAQAVLLAETEGYRRGLMTARVEAQRIAIEHNDAAIREPADGSERDRLIIMGQAAKGVADAIAGLTEP